MELAFALLTLLVDVGSGPAPVAHELAVIRTESEGSEKKSVRFSSHPLDAAYSTAQEAALAIHDLTSLGGQRKLRFVFAAELDGKPGDEIVVVREKPTGKKLAGVAPDVKVGLLDVDVVRPPSAGAVKKATIVASFAKNAIGFTVGDERVTGLAAIDHDGDGRDSLAILRTFNDGRQELTLHSVAMIKNQALAMEVASAPEIGFVGAGEVLDLARVKSLSGADLLVLRKLDASGEHIELRAAPQSIGGDVGKLLASYDDLDAGDGSVVDRVTTMTLPHVGSPYPDYALVLQRKLVDGGRQIQLAPLPLAVGSPLPSNPSLQLSAAEVGNGKELVAVFGFRRGGG